MNLGEKLYNLRRKKNLSQEELAEKLNVTRQTISKWETNQSMPDFDKIDPLCKLYGITPNDLFDIKSGEENKVYESIEDDKRKENKKAVGIAIGIVLYFFSIMWIMIAIPVIKMNPIVASAVFLLMCGVATGIIVYVCMACKKEKLIKEKSIEDRLRNQVSSVVAIIVTIIYFVISFKTMAWHLTWIIWIIYGLVDEVIKLLFILKDVKDEK